MRQRQMERQIAAIAMASFLLCVGCSPSAPAPQARFYEPRPETGTSGEIVGAAGLGAPQVDTGGEKSSPAMSVNEYLWRGALETLSFMPLSSADPFGGVIITDWYRSPATPDERFKATAYILGRELRPDAIRVAIFRQVLRDGAWTDAPVAPSTVSEIEDKMLTRARELRARAISG